MKNSRQNRKHKKEVTRKMCKIAYPFHSSTKGERKRCNLKREQTGFDIILWVHYGYLIKIVQKYILLKLKITEFVIIKMTFYFSQGLDACQV